MSWFALAIRSGAEKKIADKIGMSCWYPQRIVWVKKRKHQRSGAGREKKSYPLIPGYVFVQLAAASRFNIWRRDAKVFGFVAVDGVALAILPGEISWLMEQEAKGVYDGTQARWIELIGKRVRLAEGVFAGAFGLVEGLKNGAIVLSLDGARLPVSVGLESFVEMGYSVVR